MEVKAIFCVLENLVLLESESIAGKDQDAQHVANSSALHSKFLETESLRTKRRHMKFLKMISNLLKISIKMWKTLPEKLDHLIRFRIYSFQVLTPQRKV